jgi:hypothetical protein
MDAVSSVTSLSLSTNEIELDHAVVGWAACTMGRKGKGYPPQQITEGTESKRSGRASSVSGSYGWNVSAGSNSGSECCCQTAVSNNTRDKQNERRADGSQFRYPPPPNVDLDRCNHTM